MQVEEGLHRLHEGQLGHDVAHEGVVFRPLGRKVETGNEDHVATRNVSMMYAQR